MDENTRKNTEKELSETTDFFNNVIGLMNEESERGSFGETIVGLINKAALSLSLEVEYPDISKTPRFFVDLMCLIKTEQSKGAFNETIVGILRRAELRMLMAAEGVHNAELSKKRNAIRDAERKRQLHISKKPPGMKGPQSINRPTKINN